MMKTILFIFSLLTIYVQLNALNPSRTYKQLPEKFNMTYTAYDVPTDDGATLKAWYFPSVKGVTKKLILLCHNGEGNMGDQLRRIDQFSGLGYNVVIFDYRGFGESSEFDMDNNMYIYPHFQDDVTAMINFCRQKFVSTFDMYGWGIGAGLALGMGYNRPEIENIIADAPFLSMDDLDERFSDWDEPMEVPFAGYDKKYEPIYSLDMSPTTMPGGSKKVKLIIGSNDILFKESDMKKLVAKQPKVVDKNIFVVENPDRKDNFLVDKAAYMQVCKAFLKM